jgi:hypothetical protein
MAVAREESHNRETEISKFRRQRKTEQDHLVHAYTVLPIRPVEHTMTNRNRQDINNNTTDSRLQQWRWQLLHMFAVRLVLEVFGGGGAIWGFSEACGLRHERNVWFWRPASLFVAFLFALRWLWQLSRAIVLTQAKEQPHDPFGGKDSIPLSVRSPIGGIQLAAFEDDLVLEEKDMPLSSEVTALTKSATSPPSSNGRPTNR